MTIATADRNAFARGLFSGLPARYDALAELLSFGQNRRWRMAMLGQIGAAADGLVLDVATGTAGVAIALVRRRRGRVIGLDLTEAMLRRGAVNVRERHLADRIHLVGGQAERLPFPDGIFDALTFTYLLRYVDDPGETLRELGRVIKPGGAIASLDFAVPGSAGWRALWWLYTRLVLPAAGRPFGRAWYDVGRFLGPSISGFYRRHPVQSIVAAWEEAGLTDVVAHTLSLGGGLVMSGRKRGR